jgi:hypothetical protein
VTEETVETGRVEVEYQPRLAYRERGDGRRRKLELVLGYGDAGGLEDLYDDTLEGGDADV